MKVPVSMAPGGGTPSGGIIAAVLLALLVYAAVQAKTQSQPQR
jgi:hypothetical protein